MPYLFVYDGYATAFGKESGLASEIHASGAAVSVGESFVLAIAGEAWRSFALELYGK